MSYFAGARVNLAPVAGAIQSENAYARPYDLEDQLTETRLCTVAALADADPDHATRIPVALPRRPDREASRWRAGLLRDIRAVCYRTDPQGLTGGRSR